MMTIEFYMALLVGLIVGYWLGTIITSLLWIVRQPDDACDKFMDDLEEDQ